MKTLKILKLTSAILLGLVLTSNFDVVAGTHGIKEKRAIVITLEKPVMDLLTKFSALIDTNDFLKASEGLETFLLNDNSLNSYETGLEVPVPWLENMHFATETEDLSEVPVPWLENMHFTAESEDLTEVPVPWMENMHFTAPTVTDNVDITEVPVPWMENLHFD